ncbi:malate dehydrogenase, partial [Omnitrophica bacterium]|nr:malate dehydrogenase [Candidatus Omnitrophota bacterium]
NVGATLAKRLLESEIADVVLLDIFKKMAQGKVLDLLHAAPIIGYQKEIIGTDDYAETKDSDIVVITAGLPRQPGMSRADLVAKNSSIIREVLMNLKKSSCGAIIIVVTNPLDAMTYFAYKESGFKRERVFGMAGLLDSSRFAYIIARELKVKYKDVETMVLGQHGPDMVPLISYTKVAGKPIGNLVSEKRLDELIKELRESGASIVKLLGKGSAYYAPSAAIFTMIKAIANDEKRLMSASCVAEGEYGLSGVCTGLPIKLGKNGIEEIVQLNLNPRESESLKKSVNSTKELLSTL